MTATDQEFLDRACAQARLGASEGGVPVGAALSRNGELVAEGRNRRVQERTVILHGETDCIRQAGLFDRWGESTLYTSLSPCMMCAGTIVQFGIPPIVIADAENFGGNEEFLRSRGVRVDVIPQSGMIDFFRDWQAANPAIWNGDIGR